MEPTTRDVVGAGLLALVLLVLVVLLGAGWPAGLTVAARRARDVRNIRAAGGVEWSGDRPVTGPGMGGTEQRCRRHDRVTSARSPWSSGCSLALLVITILLGSPAIR